MSEGNMLYLILVVVGFVSFVATLLWAMLRTSPPDVGRHARTEAEAPFGVAHQKG